MTCIVRSAALLGVDARPIEVEIELAQGLPFFSIIGLADAAVKEARYRIQAALRACKLDPPHRRITINLAPAALRKDGAALDLPMALALLAAAGRIEEASLDGAVAVGELALSGQLRPVRGVLAVASMTAQEGLTRLIVPSANYQEARAVEGIEVLAADDLRQLVDHLAEGRPLPQIHPRQSKKRKDTHDLCDVRGQAQAKRALEIAAAGGHNLLFMGNPGGGKTMLARRLPSILPPLEHAERLEVTRVWSAAGMLLDRGELISSRPFRAPHHTITEAGLIGGGHPVRPGEVSLAHRGVLFLDEIPELPRRALECLRQPLEDRKVVISRARQVVRLPADFMLIGAANPCPCGWLGHSSGRCSCRPEETFRYQRRLSGPLLDRIDLVVQTPSMTSKQLLKPGPEEPSAEVRQRVNEARERALSRQGRANGKLPSQTLRASLDGASRGVTALLEQALDRLQLSARGLDRTLRVARTISDLSGAAQISEQALAEALAYRDPDSRNKAMS